MQLRNCTFIIVVVKSNCPTWLIAIWLFRLTSYLKHDCEPRVCEEHSVIRKFPDSIFLSDYSIYVLFHAVPCALQNWPFVTWYSKIQQFYCCWKNFANIFYPELPRYIQQFLWNLAVFKSPSLQQQLVFQKKKKRLGVVDLGHRTTGMSLWP